MTSMFQRIPRRDWRWLAMWLLVGLTALTAHAQGNFNSGSTGADGAFSFAGVPAGKVTLAAWHAERGDTSAPVEVPALGEVAADLRLR